MQARGLAAYDGSVVSCAMHVESVNFGEKRHSEIGSTDERCKCGRYRLCVSDEGIDERLLIGDNQISRPFVRSLKYF
jgi:hypothetical protein